MNMQPRRPSESRLLLSFAAGIADANLQGNVHGGVIMKLVDSAGGLSAVKHCRGRVVTVAMDEMSFLEPAYLGELITAQAQVNDVGRSSMEVGVRVEAENVVTGDRRHVSTAYLVFVALDERGRPCPVPPLVPETDEDRRRMEEAKIRRGARLERKEATMRRRREAADSPRRGASSEAEPGARG